MLAIYSREDAAVVSDIGIVSRLAKPILVEHLAKCEVVIFTDNDTKSQAGNKAGERLRDELAKRNGRGVIVTEYQSGLDPAEAAAANPFTETDAQERATVRAAVREPVGAGLIKSSERFENEERMKAAAKLKKLALEKWKRRETKTAIIKSMIENTTRDTAFFNHEELASLVNDALPKIKTTNAVDLMNTDFEDLRFAVPDIIPEGLTILAGPPKIGKSFLCLNIAMAVAAGGVALGSINIKDSQNVLYCGIEDSPRRLKSRMAMLDPDGHIPKRLHFLTQGIYLPCWTMLG